MIIARNVTPVPRCRRVRHGCAAPARLPRAWRPPRTSRPAESRQRSRRVAAYHEPRGKRRRPCAKLLHRSVEAHETPAKAGRNAARDERHGRTEASGHENEEHDAHRDSGCEWEWRQVRHHHDGNEGDEREDREYALLAEAVGQPADEGGGEQGREPACEIDVRKLGLLHAHVRDVVGRNERHDHEHTRHQHDHERERAQVIRHAEYGTQLRERFPALAAVEVGDERGNDAQGDDPRRRGEHGKCQERRAPGDVRGKPQAQRHPHHGSERERGRQEGRRACAPRIGDDVGNDREDEGADDTTENAGDNACREEELVRWREAAQRGCDDEAGVHREQRALATESVDPECGDEPARGGGKRVRGDEHPEMPRIDLEQPHERRRERHQDHEVQDVRELNACERDEQHDLARRQGVARRGRGSRRFGFEQGIGHQMTAGHLKYIVNRETPCNGVRPYYRVRPCFDAAPSRL